MPHGLKGSTRTISAWLGFNILTSSARGEAGQDPWIVVADKHLPRCTKVDDGLAITMIMYDRLDRTSAAHLDWPGGCNGQQEFGGARAAHGLWGVWFSRAWAMFGNLHLTDTLVHSLRSQSRPAMTVMNGQLHGDRPGGLREVQRPSMAVHPATGLATHSHNLGSAFILSPGGSSCAMVISTRWDSKCGIRWG